MPADPPADETPAPAERVDGRSLRGARNRARIVKALLELVREGELLPTAEQVSRRAGVGTRTVFRHFDDMESLYAEMNAAIRAEIQPLLDPPFGKGGLEARARALVRHRVAIWERIAPFKRSDNLQRWHSPYLERSHADDQRRLRADLLRWLPELADADESVVEALDLATSFDAWNRLRTDQRLGAERARQVLEATVLALLG